MPEEERKIVVTEDKIERALDRLASIAIGFNWKHKATLDVAFSSANTTLVAHCYYLKVPHTQAVDGMIRKSLVKAASVYYTRTGVLREHPLGEQEVDFSGDTFKLT